MSIVLVSGQRLEWTKVRTGENTQGASNFNERKINVSNLIRVLTNRIFHVVHWPKSINF
jgi:hypothetical protein